MNNWDLIILFPTPKNKKKCVQVYINPSLHAINVSATSWRHKVTNENEINKCEIKSYNWFT